ncbi:MAG: hypothetical protein NZ750_05120 [Anaerolineae bacterium]|nr:hypothetical protein [Anaerolineae bacterium]MDW8173580.1 hypothetical protein [Anaerolineae bacterium]
MKQKQASKRVYNPEALLRVAQLQVTSQGLHGVTEDGKTIIDVHHPQHPQTRWRGDNPISLGFLPHYEQMRARFGPHIADGLAGENIIIACDGLPDVGREFFIENAEGQRIHLTQVIPAPPCAEFSAFCLGGTPSAGELRAALEFLDGGRRGYYALPQLGEARRFVCPGDVLYTV